MQLPHRPRRVLIPPAVINHYHSHYHRIPLPAGPPPGLGSVDCNHHAYPAHTTTPMAYYRTTAGRVILAAPRAHLLRVSTTLHTRTHTYDAAQFIVCGVHSGCQFLPGASLRVCCHTPTSHLPYPAHTQPALPTRTRYDYYHYQLQTLTYLPAVVAVAQPGLYGSLPLLVLPIPYRCCSSDSATTRDTLPGYGCSYLGPSSNYSSLWLNATLLPTTYYPVRLHLPHITFTALSWSGCLLFRHCRRCCEHLFH